MSEPAQPAAAPPTEADQLRAARQRRRRDRALLLTPALAFGLVIVTIWALVIWYAIERPRKLLDEQRRELASAVRTLGLQTEPVLRQAEAGLRNVDLWLLSHRGDDAALNDPTLTLLADGVRAGSRQMVDVMLVARTGKLRRLQAQADAASDGGSIEGSAAFAQISGLVPEDMVIGVPLQLDSGRTWLPLLMRLSRPLGDYNAVLAVVDLKRLQALHALHTPGPLASLVMVRTDGVTLSRQPHLPGFVGRNLFDEFPARRNDLAADEGFFASTGVLSDGRRRMGAFVTLHDFNLKLLLSDTEDAALAAHRAQRTIVIAAAALVTLGLFLLGRWLSLLQRAARLRAAALQATSDAIPLGLFRCDESGRMVYVNDSYLRMHGITREDMGWGWTRLIPPEHRDLMIQRWKQTVADGEPVDVVQQLRRADNGQLRWIAVRAAPLYFDGQVAGLAGTVEDVTERGEQEKARQTLAAIFDITPDIVCQTRANGDLIYMNPAARARFGLAADAPLDNARIEQFFSARQVRAYRRLVLAKAVRHGHWRGHAQLQLGDELVPMDFTVLVHSDPRGRTETVSAILRDVSAQARAQRERERSEAMLLAVAHTARAGLVVSDTQGRVIFFNAAFEQQRQKVLADWVGRPLTELFGPQGYAARAPVIAAALAGQASRQELADDVERDGRSYDLQYAPLRVQSGEIEGVICIEVDVTEARREEARLRLASLTDALTQLLNRAGFDKSARQALAAPEGQLIGLLYLDLDKFKPVNDQHGHPTGDALLKAVALRLRHALRPADLVARLGGDEFAVLLPQMQDAGAAAIVCDKLLRALSAPYHIGELELEIGVSIGYATTRTGAATLEALVASADASLYEAKRAGRARYRGGSL